MSAIKKFLNEFKKVQLILSAILYLAIILIQAFYPKASVFQMIIAAIVFLIIQALFNYANADRDKEVIQREEL